jgi:hypothetical protein
LVFILAIDPLQRIIEAASQKGILKLVLPKAANLITLFPLCRRCGNIHKPNYLGASSLTQNNLDFFLGSAHGSKSTYQSRKSSPYGLRIVPKLSYSKTSLARYANFMGKSWDSPNIFGSCTRVEVQPWIDKRGTRLPS